MRAAAWWFCPPAISLFWLALGLSCLWPLMSMVCESFAPNIIVWERLFFLSWVSSFHMCTWRSGKQSFDYSNLCCNANIFALPNICHSLNHFKFNYSVDFRSLSVSSLLIVTWTVPLPAAFITFVFLMLRYSPMHSLSSLNLWTRYPRSFALSASKVISLACRRLFLSPIFTPTGDSSRLHCLMIVSAYKLNRAGDRMHLDFVGVNQCIRCILKRKEILIWIMLL